MEWETENTSIPDERNQPILRSQATRQPFNEQNNNLTQVSITNNYSHQNNNNQNLCLNSNSKARIASELINNQKLFQENLFKQNELL